MVDFIIQAEIILSINPIPPFSTASPLPQE